MFRYVVFIGFLALSYSNVARAEGSSINYDLIDDDKLAPVDPLDEECAAELELKVEDFHSTDPAVENEVDIKFLFRRKTLQYTLCLALQKELVNNDGSINEENIKNLKKEVKSFGYFDENFVNTINTTCTAGDIATLINPKEDQINAAGSALMELGVCLGNDIRKFYEKPEREAYEKEHESIFSFFSKRYTPSKKVNKRAEKALKGILLKKPEFVFNPKIY